MRALFAALSGALFGLGLLVSGMTDTTKVQGWLDLFGDWDPTLAFVLGGAILPMAVAWAALARRGTAFLGAPLPARRANVIDRPLAWGAALFGAGWALVGLCPGPAMASLSWGGASGAVFFASMVAGMLIARPVGRRMFTGRAGLNREGRAPHGPEAPTPTFSNRTSAHTATASSVAISTAADPKSLA